MNNNIDSDDSSSLARRGRAADVAAVMDVLFLRARGAITHVTCGNGQEGGGGVGCGGGAIGAGN